MARVQILRPCLYRPFVAKDSEGGDAAAGGLGRLPPGRHGLSREFVTENQRNRITAGMIAAIAEHGYHDATISEIAAAAGVSRRTFYSYFASKEECFFDTYEVIADHLRDAAMAAAAEHEQWQDQVRARILTTLEFFSSNPDLARFCLIAPSRAGDKIAGRYRQAVTEVYDELIGAMPVDIAAKAPSPAVQQSLIGGMAALVMEKVEAGDGDTLPQLLPDFLELFLTPYLGREEAVRVARQAT
jgi:AcrR family transcriptional regulator